MIELREYQKNIAKTCLFHNCLVVLPTGLGKTHIAFYIMSRYKTGLFLAPTKPLVEQQAKVFMEHYSQDVEIATGDNRKRQYKARYIFATPQTIERDLDRLDPERFDVIVFDEAHKAVGNYAYVKIAKHFRPKRIIGLTASPGHDIERIQEILHNLRIQRIEIRTEEDPDVKPYMQKKLIRYVPVELTPEYKELVKMLGELMKKHAETLKKFHIPVPTKATMSASMQEIDKLPPEHRFPAMIAFSQYVNLSHIKELLETESVLAVKNYLQKLDRKKQSVKALLKDLEPFLKKLDEVGEHPKVKKAVSLIKALKGKKGILFSQYTDQIRYLKDLLEKEGIKAEIFIGKHKGYTRKDQLRTLERFRKGEFDVLVSSSIGEEGLDVPVVDFVIFYEPVPSAIRTIQRMGRTGRFREGYVYMLVAKGTRDQGYMYAAKKRTKQMYSTLNNLKKTLEEAKKKTLLDF
ncbi:MAG: DEAD/DEAH box helicase family protein [Candidatus Micrarchaeota archaeon]|nr:DEAD/DEAH box helicase family protein [Candidatus Micrarchaeota archaeon]